MWRKFCGWLLKIMGWTVDDPNVVPEDKCIILGVPHTSAWDFVISYLFYTSIGGKAKVMVKKEFFFWPIGGLLRKIGGLPVDRKNATRLVLSTIHEMKRPRCVTWHSLPKAHASPSSAGRQVSTPLLARWVALFIWVTSTGAPSTWVGVRRWNSPTMPVPTCSASKHCTRRCTS